MKALVLFNLFIVTLMVSAAPVLAQNSSLTTTQESIREPRLSDLGLKLNPQLGVSSFTYSESKTAQTKLSGGATVELGQASRKLETGLLLVQLPDSSMLTIPMMAKLRVLSLPTQNWYGKFGFLPGFEISDSRSQKNPIEILGAIGAGGRLAFNKRADLVVEATYNRGMMEHLSGFLVTAGMSFGL